MKHLLGILILVISLSAFSSNASAVTDDSCTGVRKAPVIPGIDMCPGYLAVYCSVPCLEHPESKFCRNAWCTWMDKCWTGADIECPDHS